MRSIMPDKSQEMCYMCMKLHGDYRRRSNLEEHHVLYGAGRRKLSEKYGLKVYLCHEHHNDEHSKEAVHFNRENRILLCKAAQRAFKEHFPEKDFTEIFGRNYLQEPSKRQTDEKDRNPQEAAGFMFLEAEE